MYSYEKQIERLLKFVKKVHSYGHDDWCDGDIKSCLACYASQLLNDEPVRYTGKLMGTGEGYEQPVGLLENPSRRTLETPVTRESTYYLGQCE